MKRVYIYEGFERFWHWTQAILIIFLAFTGFEVHGSYSFFGYENAVVYHRIAGWTLVGLYVFAAFWHFATGEVKQYIPTFKFMKAQLDYYIFGIFRNAPHPVKKNRLSKLNPLQKITYFSLMVIIIPLMMITGLLYYYYRVPQATTVNPLNISNLHVISFWHVLGAYFLVMFLIGHLYLITTGHTVLTNLKAMITGWEDIEEEEGEEETSNQENNKENN